MSEVAKAVEAMKAKFNPSAAAGLDLIFGCLLYTSPSPRD